MNAVKFSFVDGAMPYDWQLFLSVSSLPLNMWGILGIMKTVGAREGICLSSARQDTWYHLDNAANLFPAVSGDKNTNVFRLSCELRDIVNKELLQQAVVTALRSFSGGGAEPTPAAS